MKDQAALLERGSVSAGTETHDAVRWRCLSTLLKSREGLQAHEFDELTRRAALQAAPRVFGHTPDWDGIVDAMPAHRRAAVARLALLEGKLSAREMGPIDRIEVVEGNLLMTAGATALWNKLIGAAGTVFDNSNAYLGVGDSSTAEGASQTDLQAASNKVRVAMDATYPTVSTNTVTFRSTFGTSTGNFAWAEWATFNASSSGTMLQRKVQSLGTKVSGASWQFSVTLSLS